MKRLITKTVSMLRKVIFALTLSVCIIGLCTQSLKADEPEKSADETLAGKTAEKGKVSLAEVEPELYYGLRRHSKFYGDDNTVHGDIFHRSQLLGNPMGLRDRLVEMGIYVDVGITQFLGANVSGGVNDGSIRNNGTADYWMEFDTGKAGLWSGGSVFLHGETSWEADQSINLDVGSLLPANYDATMPVPNESTSTFSEFYMVQALPANTLFLAGRISLAGIADLNNFAKYERSQFSYTGFVNNPILGVFYPYVAWGAAVLWAPKKEHNFVVAASATDGDANTIDTKSIFNGNNTYAVGYTYSPTFAGRPGNYRILPLYTSKDPQSFEIDKRHLIGEILGIVPAAKKNENYSVTVNFDQYLWVKGGSVKAYDRERRLKEGKYPGVTRHHLPPVGIGIFGRAGWAPKNRNVIDQFYSFGIGGYGMIMPGRDQDQWGVGWSGTHISDDVRSIARVLRKDMDALEHGFEAFYNFEVTPATHLTMNAQVIDSTLESVDTATTVSFRLQLDF
jgi:porin